jgi:hypothetical protein
LVPLSGEMAKIAETVDGREKRWDMNNSLIPDEGREIN